MLELIGVVVTEGHHGRLERLGFEVREGEVLGLVGGSGAGKTAALHVAAGLVTPQRGRVVLDGRDVARGTGWAASGKLRAATGLATEHLPGPFDVSVGAWLTFWARLDGVPAKEIEARRAAVVQTFSLPAADRLVVGLSRGERRRLGLARLWLRAPRLLLLDAPSDGLDGQGLRDLTAAIRQAVAEGRTVILSASAPFLPAAVCDRVVCMAAGAASAEARRGAEDFEARIARAQGWSS